MHWLASLSLSSSHAHLVRFELYTEADVVGGAEVFREKMCEVFYRVSKHCEAKGESLWNSSENPIAVVEPEDSELL